MKSIQNNLIMILLAAIFSASLTCLAAQDVDKRLGEAQSAYNAGNLEAARFALQQAMNEVDLAIGREILKLLPSNMGKMGYKEADDQVGSASMGYAGLYVNRSYRSDENASVDVQVIADSPLIAGVNTILSLPVLGLDPDQKRIRVGNYRSLLQKRAGSDGEISWTIQVPFGSSLLTINYKGIPEENAVVEMANTLPVDQISRLVQ